MTLPRHSGIDCSCLDATSQSTFHPLTSHPFIKSISLQFRDKDIVWDFVKCFMEIHADDICCLSLVHLYSHFIIHKATRLVRHELHLVKLCWLSQITSLLSICPSTASRRTCSFQAWRSQGAGAMLQGWRVEETMSCFSRIQLDV